MAKTSDDWIVHYKSVWLNTVVPAAVDVWLTEALTGPNNDAPYGKEINTYADHPTYGFLKPGKKEATENASDYVGFINSDMYSQIDLKINSLHSGTGTKKSQAVVSAFKKLTAADARGAYYVAAGMAANGPGGYLPLSNQSQSLGGSPQMTQKDIIFFLSLFLHSGQTYNYGGAGYSSAATRGFYLGGNSTTWLGILLASPTPSSNKPGKMKWTSNETAASIKGSAFKLPWGTYVKELGDIEDWIERHLRKEFKKHSDNPVFRVTRKGYITDKALQPFQNEFVARIARNFPELVSARVHAIIDDIIKDVVRGNDADDENPDLVTQPDPLRPVNAEPIKEGPDAVSRYGGFLKPFDLQCFLMENINYISQIKDEAKNYKYLGRVKQGSGNPGNLVSFIQHAGRDQEVQALLETCPDAYALLSPLIRLYRVDYKGEKTLEPYREMEIPFPNFIDPNDITLIGKGDLGRVPGAGIKSFSWSLDGVNPAEVDNNISANLSLYFQSIQDLFSLNQNEKGEYDLQAGLAGRPTYLDLIIGSGTSFRQSPVSPTGPPPRHSNICDTVTEAYEGEKFRIKVLVGWSTPDDVNTIIAATGMDETAANAWKKAVEKSRTALYLQVTRHQLNFKDNGSVELSIDYQASLSGIMRARNADIFDGDTIYTESLDKAEEKKDEIEADDKKEKDATNSADSGSSETAGEETELQKAKEKVDDFRKKDKMAKYRRFLSILYDSNKIYTIKINSATYKEGLISREPDPEKRAQMAKTRTSADPTTRGFGDPQQSDSFDDSLLRNLATFSATDGNTTTNALGGPDEFEQYATIQLEKDDDGSINVPYFYLGDLINGVLEYLKHLPVDKKGRKGSLQMLLGDIEIMDPLLGFGVKELAIRCAGAKAKKVIRSIADVDPMRFSGTGANSLMFSTNIGSIPISLTYFQEWYVNKVIRPQREGYSLLSFVKDVASALIGKAFNSICFENALQYTLKFDVATFNLGRSFVGKTSSAKWIAKAKRTGDTRSRRQLTGGDSPVIPSLILYSVNSKPRTGNYGVDLGNGIYHYFLGGACGLNKNIKFKRMDMPYYREARISRRGNLSAMQLRELYSISMDMIGNTLHKNGQYLYIEPIGVGIGNLKAQGTIPNLARILGIGGYHLVTKVSHTISDAGFNVSLEALQEGMSFSDNKIVGLTHYKTEEPRPDENPEKEDEEPSDPVVEEGDPYGSTPGRPD